MKRLPGLLFSATLILPLPGTAQIKNESVRINNLFNFDWKYKPGNIPNAQTVNYVDNSDHGIDQLFSGNTIKLHNGFAMAIVRAQQTEKLQ